jgi:hypothetical protein
MRHAATIACVLAAAGCGNKSSQSTGASGSASATGTAASGSASAASGSGSAKAAAAVDAAPAGCDLTGDYRVRYRSNGEDGWWLRLNVSGTPPKAKLTEDANMLGLAAGPIDVTADPAGCKLVAKATSDHAGDVQVTMTLDPKTNAVTGQLTRSKKVSDDDSPTAVAGVRDVGAPKTPACLHPGVFELDLDDKAKWKNAEASDKRSCENAPLDALPTFVRVEPFGDTVVIDETDSEAPHLTRSSGGKVTVTGDCAYTVSLATERMEIDFQLTFAGDQVSGKATNAKVQHIEENGEAEDLWNCTAHDVAVTGKRL